MTQKWAPRKFLLLWSNPVADSVFWLVFLSPLYSPTPPQHTHTHSVHTSGCSIPVTKPHQQGGNDPATTVVMMESVGGLTCSLALPNKSPNSSVYISADPANRSNAPIRGVSPHALFHLSLRCENSCWPPHSMIIAVHTQDESKDRRFGPQNKVCGPTMNQTETSLIPLSSIHSLTICLPD